jgi:hypothetical protein
MFFILLVFSYTPLSVDISPHEGKKLINKIGEAEKDKKDMFLVFFMFCF